MPTATQSRYDPVPSKSPIEVIEIDSHVPLKDLKMPGELVKPDQVERSDAANDPALSLPFFDLFRDTFLTNRSANDGELRDTFLESLMIDSLLDE